MFFTFLSICLASGCGYVCYALGLQKTENRDKLFVYMQLALTPLTKTTWKKLIGEKDPKLPVISIEKPFVIDSKVLKQYYEVCKLPTEEEFGQVPIMFLEALALPSAGFDIFLNEKFPFPALGAVHVRNDVTQYRAINAKEKITLALKTKDEIRKVARGSEFDIEGYVFDESNEVIWSSVASFLVMHKHKTKIESNAAADEFEFSETIVEKEVKMNSSLGLEYASIGGDFNPIHLYPITAKPFGFRSHIIHGLYSAAYCVGEAMRAMTSESKSKFSYPVRTQCSFKRPIFLPGKTELQISELKTAGNDDKNGVCFQLLNKDKKVMLDGYMSCEKP